MSTATANTTLAACCIKFLNLDDFDRRRATDENETILDVFPFEDGLFPPEHEIPLQVPDPQDCVAPIDPWEQLFEYAASNWAFHLASSEPCPALAAAAVSLSVKKNTLSRWSLHFRKSFQGWVNLPERLDPLLVAAYFGHNSVAESVLSKAFIYMDQKSPLVIRPDLALTWASRMGHLGIVKLLFEHSREIRCLQFVEGRSALSWAASGGFTEIASLLLSYDESQINSKDEDGCCPISLAVMNGHVDTVKTLLAAKNINLNIADRAGWTPLFYMIRQHDFSVSDQKIFTMLLDDQ